MENVVTLQDLAVYMEQNLQHCFSVGYVASGTVKQRDGQPGEVSSTRLKGK